MSEITQKELKERVHYDPDTGIVTWKTNRKSTEVGKEVGYIANSHGRISRATYINYKRYYVHRLIWLYIHGYFPEQIDHIDGNGLNNKLSNLRAVTHAENQKNRAVYKTNNSGCPGVVWRTERNKWVVCINVNGIRAYLGQAADLFSAACLRKSAELVLGYHENHGRTKCQLPKTIKH